MATLYRIKFATGSTMEIYADEMRHDAQKLVLIRGGKEILSADLGAMGCCSLIELPSVAAQPVNRPACPEYR